MHAALDHYQLLGVAVMPHTVEADGVVASVRQIHLYLKEDRDPAPRTAAAAHLTVFDCDTLEREWSATGAPSTSDPSNVPY
jgi:hypothetical protein